MLRIHQVPFRIHEGSDPLTSCQLSSSSGPTYDPWAPSLFCSHQRKFPATQVSPVKDGLNAEGCNGKAVEEDEEPQVVSLPQFTSRGTEARDQEETGVEDKV